MVFQCEENEIKMLDLSKTMSELWQGFQKSLEFGKTGASANLYSFSMWLIKKCFAVKIAYLDVKEITVIKK